MTQSLTWSLVVPTYQRESILLRCLHCAATQTWPPSEIIVVDASVHWETTWLKVKRELLEVYPTIEWKYVPAQRLSSASQRNQGIDLASGEVIFLIDDDSLMYPDCAEKVMQVYAQDSEQRVAGVMPALEALPPDLVAPSCLGQVPKWSLANRLHIFQVYLRSLGKRWIKDDDIFIPYDFAFPRYQLPATLNGMAVHPVPMVHGARMSYRRKILETVRFEELLERYAVNEDNDVCYRASRLGMLLQALRAKICHLQVAQGRVSRFTATALWGFNQIVLHRLHSRDLARFKKLFLKLLWRRLVTQTLKDLLDRRWSLPSTRGIWFVMRHQEKIFAKSLEELRSWYPQFQMELLRRDN